MRVTVLSDLVQLTSVSCIMTATVNILSYTWCLDVYSQHLMVSFSLSLYLCPLAHENAL
jgi:hypothetical protein